VKRLVRERLEMLCFLSLCGWSFGSSVSVKLVIVVSKVEVRVGIKSADLIGQMGKCGIQS
jgi:hypothetical protein